jgi:hypothetical protein
LEAYNEVGWSLVSTVNTSGIEAQTVPLNPTLSPQRNDSGTTKTDIQVDMPDITLDTNMGGSAITTYNLQYNGGGSSEIYESIFGENPLTLTRTFTKKGLVTNEVYKFRYRIKNKHGWSSFSPIANIRAATIPAKMSTPTFTVNNEVNLRIIWTEPDTGGNPISAYLLKIKDINGAL